MTGEHPRDEPLTREETLDRVRRLRQEIRGRQRPAEPSTSAVPDDPDAIAYQMEQAAHRERLETELAQRDETIAGLEDEVTRLRAVLGDMAVRLGTALIDPAAHQQPGGEIREERPQAMNIAQTAVRQHAASRIWWALPMSATLLLAFPPRRVAAPAPAGVRS